MLDQISALSEFQTLCERINAKEISAFGSLGLMRAAHYPVTASLYEQLQRPILYRNRRFWHWTRSPSGIRKATATSFPPRSHIFTKTPHGACPSAMTGSRL